MYLDSLNVDENPDSKQAQWCKPEKAGAVHCVGEADFSQAALKETADSLTAGDKLELSWNHDYVTKGSSQPRRSGYGW